MEWCRLRGFGMSGRVFGLRVRVVAAALHLCGWEGGVQKPADLNHRRMQPAQPRHEHEVVVVNLYAQFGASGVPFFVIDRRYGISGAQPPEVFSQTLEQAASD